MFARPIILDPGEEPAIGIPSCFWTLPCPALDSLAYLWGEKYTRYLSAHARGVPIILYDMPK